MCTQHTLFVSLFIPLTIWSAFVSLLYLKQLSTLALTLKMSRRDFNYFYEWKITLKSSSRSRLWFQSGNCVSRQLSSAVVCSRDGRTAPERVEGGGRKKVLAKEEEEKDICLLQLSWRWHPVETCNIVSPLCCHQIFILFNGPLEREETKL